MVFIVAICDFWCASFIDLINYIMGLRLEILVTFMLQDSIEPEIYEAKPVIAVENGESRESLVKSPDSISDVVSLDDSISSCGSGGELHMVYNLNNNTIAYQCKSPTSEVIR